MTESNGSKATVREVYAIVQRIEDKMDGRLRRVETRLAWMLGIGTTVAFLLSIGFAKVASG